MYSQNLLRKNSVSSDCELMFDVIFMDHMKTHAVLLFNKVPVHCKRKTVENGEKTISEIISRTVLFSFNSRLGCSKNATAIAANYLQKLKENGT